ncbi:MAG: phage tail tape measure protein [Candidatus Limnocylindrales bacterium]
MSEQHLAIIVTAQDLASGKLGKVRQELAALGPGGKLAAVGIGTSMAAVSKGEQALGNFKNRLSGLVGPLGMIGLGAGIFGVGAAFKTAVGDATTFHRSMELIATQAGATQSEVDSMSKAILNLAPTVGTSATELSAGLYHIESAGIRGAQALDILKVAAEGAKVGNTDLESVTNALIATVTSGVGGITNMTQGMGVLNAIVGAGNMRMGDLTAAMSTGILSSAKAFGISIQSVGAAIADMTNQGVPAIDAATRLRMTISLLGAPSAKASKELKLIGLTGTELANSMRGPDGILGAVALLNEHLKASGMNATQQTQLLSAAFGGGRSSTAILTLLGSQQKLAEIQKQVNTGAGTFGDAWAKTSQEADMAFARLSASVNTLGIQLGSALLPPLADVATQVSTWLGNEGNRASLVGGLQAAIGLAQGLGAEIGHIVPIIVGVGSGAKAIWDAIPAPLRDLIAQVAIGDRVIHFLFGMSPVHFIMDAIGSQVLPKLLGNTLGGFFNKGSIGNPMFVKDVTGGLPNLAPAAGGAAGAGEAAAAGAAMPVALAAGALGLILASPVVAYELGKNHILGFNPGNARMPNARGAFGLTPSGGMVPTGRADGTSEMVATRLAENSANLVGLSVHADRLAGSMDDLNAGLHAQYKSLLGEHAIQTVRTAAGTSDKELIAKGAALAGVFQTSKAPNLGSLEVDLAELKRIAGGGDVTTRAALGNDIATMTAVLNEILGVNRAQIGALEKLQSIKDQSMTVNLSVRDITAAAAAASASTPTRARQIVYSGAGRTGK